MFLVFRKITCDTDTWTEQSSIYEEPLQLVVLQAKVETILVRAALVPSFHLCPVSQLELSNLSWFKRKNALHVSQSEVILLCILYKQYWLDAPNWLNKLKLLYPLFRLLWSNLVRAADKRVTWCVYDKDQMDHISALQIKNTSESDLRSCEVT